MNISFSRAYSLVLRALSTVIFANIFFFFFVFLGLHLQHMEIPRAELELKPPTYTTTTATPDLSHVCNLHHRSQQCRVLNHRAKPGVKPTSSGILVGFLT